MSLPDRLLELVWSKGAAAPAALEPRSHLDAAHPVPHRHEGALGRDVVHHQDPICLPEVLLGNAPKPEPRQNQRHSQNHLCNDKTQNGIICQCRLSARPGSPCAWCVPQGQCLHTGDRSDPSTFETGQAAMGEQESCQIHGAEKARRKAFVGQEERSRRICLSGIGKGNFLLKGKLMEKTRSL